MDSGVASLLGVIVGALSASLVKVVEYRVTRANSARYLAVRVVCELERYIRSCIEVARDEGWADIGEEFAEISVESPDFEPAALDVDWKSISPTLCYMILDMPAFISKTRARIGTKWEADPPDFRQFFARRRRLHCELGLEAIRLSEELCRLAKLAPANHLDKKAFVDVLDALAVQARQAQLQHGYDSRYASPVPPTA